jgi:Catalase
VRLIATLSLATAALAFALPPALADEQVTPNALVTALEQVYGVHPGQRRNHTKGTCATGSFVGLPEATSYSRSALFSGATIPVVARFSLGGGNPDAPDAGKGPRGMALEFKLASFMPATTPAELREQRLFRHPHFQVHRQERQDDFGKMGGSSRKTVRKNSPMSSSHPCPATSSNRP